MTWAIMSMKKIRQAGKLLQKKGHAAWVNALSELLHLVASYGCHIWLPIAAR